MPNHKFINDLSDQRVDLFLSKCLETISRSKIEKIIKNEGIKVNSEIIYKKNFRLEINDSVEINIDDIPEKKETKPPEGKLDILWEDEDILVINKPEGVVVHPGAGETRETILDIFRHFYPQIDEIRDTDRPGIVHRLDMGTSGALVLAKNFRSMRKMQKLFKRRDVTKEYIAIVQGRMRYLNGDIEFPLIRCRRNKKKFTVTHDPSTENARYAHTEYSVLKYFEEQNCTLLKIFLHTGRTHQIRVHMSAMDNPVLGDSLYGSCKSFPRLALHAHRIAFFHPVNDEFIDVYTPVPEEFAEYTRGVNLKNIE